jgi:hypothetical protein
VELPVLGLVELTDAETGETVIVDTRNSRTRAMFSEQARARREEIVDMFRRIRADRIEIRAEEGYVEPLIQYFRRRNKMVS